MPKVMFVTNSLTGGGAERAMNLAANELMNHGWAVSLVPINSGESDFVELTCPIFPLHRPWRSGLLGTIRAFIKFIAVVNKWKPEILVMTCDLPELFGALLPKKRKIIIVEEAKAPWGTRVRLGRLVRRILTARKVKWVAASHHLNIWPQNFNPDEVIPNALTVFEQEKLPIEFHPTEERLVYVGRMSPEKQPEWFIEICRETKMPGRLFGTGFLADNLERAAHDAEVELKFCGFVRNPWAYTDGYDLIVIPSASEGDGLVVIEAISSGLPLLLSDIPEFRHFGLPERHYCANVPAFVQRVKEFKGRFQMLRVTEELAENILSHRAPSKIGYSWNVYLQSLSGVK